MTVAARTPRAARVKGRRGSAVFWVFGRDGAGILSRPRLRILRSAMQKLRKAKLAF
jgi:hypothetical protein